MALKFYGEKIEPYSENANCTAEAIDASNFIIYNILKDLKAVDGDMDKVGNRTVLKWIERIKNEDILNTSPGMSCYGTIKKLQALFKLLGKKENRALFAHSDLLTNSVDFINRGYVKKSQSGFDWNNYHPKGDNTKRPLVAAWELMVKNHTKKSPLGLDFYKIVDSLVIKNENGNYEITRKISDADIIDLQKSTEQHLVTMQQGEQFNKLFERSEDYTESGE